MFHPDLDATKLETYFLFHFAKSSLSNPICFQFVWFRRTMIPGKIFTSFVKFLGVVSVNDFRLFVRLHELLQVSLCLLTILFDKKKIHDRKEVLCVLTYLRGLSLSKYIQFFDVNCGLFMRLHLSSDIYYYRRTERFRQGIYFSGIQFLFADHVYRRTGIHNNFFLMFKSWCRQAPIFRRWEECCFVFPEFFKTLLASFHAASLSLCLFLRTDPQILERWVYADEVSLGQINPSERFRAESMRDVQQLSWISHVGLVSASLSSSVRLTTTSAAPYPERRNPIVVHSVICTQQVRDSTHDGCHALQRGATFYHDFLSWLTTGCHVPPCRSYFFNMATALSSSFFWTFYWVVHQPDDVHTSTSHRICNNSWTCRTSTLEDATFHKMEWRKLFWSNPCMDIETFYHWDSCLWDFGFSMFFFHSVVWKNSETVWLSHLCALIDFVTETIIVSIRALPVGFPLPTISKNSLLTLFCPLILAHGVCLIISVSGFKILNSWILLDPSFSPLSSICDNQVTLFLMNLHIVQFKYGLEFLRLSYS